MAGLAWAASENAAHRIAVEWDDDRRSALRVCIPRRDTNSTLNTLVGGHLFPGAHHLAEFRVSEPDDSASIAMRSRDGQGSITVRGNVTHQLSEGSLFSSVDEASAFFERGLWGSLLGVRASWRASSWRRSTSRRSPGRSGGGIALLREPQLFPDGAVEYDNALLMRDIDHRWHQRESLCGGDDRTAA